MNRERLKYWLALARTKGLRHNEIKTALNDVADAADFFKASGRSGNSVVSGVKNKIAGFSAWDRIDAELDKAEKLGIKILTLKDAAYPSLLKETHNPPPILYAKGRTAEEPFAAVAVVGTRRASHYGLSMSENISFGLAGAGVTIVSGLARGCDTYAHNGALNALGYTIAVLGTGVDIVYPKENKKLYDRIAVEGLLLSEFPLGTPPLAQNFPARNRIISGISLGVVVVEAPLKSGAMITAKMALDENRDVFALPGQASGAKSSGSNKLIKEGAALAENAEDIFTALFPGKKFKKPELQTGKNKAPGSKQEGSVLKSLEDGPLHVDELAHRTKTPVSALLTALLELELKGLVQQHPGKIFSRKIT